MKDDGQEQVLDNLVDAGNSHQDRKRHRRGSVLDKEMMGLSLDMLI